MRNGFFFGSIACAVVLAGCGSESSARRADDTVATVAISEVSNEPVETTVSSDAGSPLTVLLCGPVPVDNDAIAALLRSRLADFADPEFTVDAGSPTQVEIHVPGGVTSEQAASICATPRFEARPVLQMNLSDTGADVSDDPLGPAASGWFVGTDGATFLLGPVVVGGSSFEATAAAESSETGWNVNATLTPNGLADWNAAAASCFAGDEMCPSRQLALLLDDQVLTAPTVNASEFASDVQIAGSFNEDEARSLAAAINAGVAGFGLLSMEPTTDGDGDGDTRGSTATKGDPFCTANEAAAALGAAADFENASRDSIEAQVAAMREAGRAVQALAPLDIMTTVGLVIDRQEKLFSLLSDNDFDRAAAAASDEGRTLLDDEKYQAAETDFTTYLEEKCGIASA
jgi:hypothetical protein